MVVIRESLKDPTLASGRLAGLLGSILDFCTRHDRKRAGISVRCWRKRLSSRLRFLVLVALTVPLTCPASWWQLARGSMDVHWNEGSPKTPIPLSFAQRDSGTAVQGFRQHLRARQAIFLVTITAT